MTREQIEGLLDEVERFSQLVRLLPCGVLQDAAAADLKDAREQIVKAIGEQEHTG